jgi:hypothetical protein
MVYFVFTAGMQNLVEATILAKDAHLHFEGIHTFTSEVHHGAQ